MIKYFTCLVSGLLFFQNIILRGKVIDSLSGHPIENVDIYFKNSSFGTISNFKGNFIINNDEISKKDTLIFSHIGYDEYKVKVGDFLSLTNRLITLSSKVTELAEVNITPVTVKHILEEAINNYESNSINTELFLNGYIKQISEKDHKINRLAYANILLRIPETKKQHRKKVKFYLLDNKFKLKSNSRILASVPLFKIYQLADFLKVKEQLKYFIKNLEFFDNISLKRDRYGSYSIYKILLEQKITKEKKNLFMINIDQNTYAILSVEIKADRGVGNEKKWITILKDQEKTIKRRPSFSSGKISFRPYKDKWVLRELFCDLSVDFKIKSKKEEDHFTNYNYINVVINNISKTPPRFFNRNKLDLHRDVFNQIHSNYTIRKIPIELFNSKDIKFIESYK